VKERGGEKSNIAGREKPGNRKGLEAFQMTRSKRKGAGENRSPQEEGMRTRERSKTKRKGKTNSRCSGITQGWNRGGLEGKNPVSSRIHTRDEIRASEGKENLQAPRGKKRRPCTLCKHTARTKHIEMGYVAIGEHYFGKSQDRSYGADWVKMEERK